MRKTVAVLAVASVLAAAALVARGANTADRPSGVSAANWIAVSDGFGFVVVPPRNEPVALPRGALLLSASGERVLHGEAAGRVGQDCGVGSA